MNFGADIDKSLQRIDISENSMMFRRRQPNLGALAFRVGALLLFSNLSQVSALGLSCKGKPKDYPAFDVHVRHTSESKSFFTAVTGLDGWKSEGAPGNCPREGCAPVCLFLLCVYWVCSGHAVRSTEETV